MQGRAIVAAARELHARGLVTGTAGNVSVRTPRGVRITPTRLAYGRMRPRDLVLVGPDGAVLRGRRAPSLELPMHLAVYAGRPDVAAIVHTHSPHATAWSHLGAVLPEVTEDAHYLQLGPVRTSAPARAGSDHLAEAVAGALGASSAALIGGHGVVAVGPDLRHALDVAAAVELQAQVAWLLRAGVAPELPAYADD